MGAEATSERVFHRLAENAFSLPTKLQAYRLCLADGKLAALSYLRGRLSAAFKAGLPVDLNALRRTITELEELTEEEIARRLAEFKPLSIYRIAPPPTLEEKKARSEQERTERKRQAQEWLDSEQSEEDEIGDLDEDEDGEDVNAFILE